MSLAFDHDLSSEVIVADVSETVVAHGDLRTVHENQGDGNSRRSTEPSMSSTNKLKAHPGDDEIGRTRRSRWEPGGLPKESRGHSMSICVCNPVAAADVQTQRFECSFSVWSKMAHYGSCSSSTITV